MGRISIVMANDSQKMDIQNTPNTESSDSFNSFYEPIQIDDDNRSIDSYFLEQDEGMDYDIPTPQMHNDFEPNNLFTNLFLTYPNSQNTEGLTDNEILSPQSTESNLINSSLSSSLDSQNSEITLESIQGNTQTGLDFLSSKERVQSPEHQDKYFTELSKIQLSVFFNSFVKESLNSNCNLIYYFNIESHGKLIRSMALSKRMNDPLRTEYFIKIEKLFSDLFSRIKYLYYLHKTNLFNELNDLKELFDTTDVQLRIIETENTINQLDDIFWDNMSAIIQEASKFKLYQLINDNIDFFPKKDQSLSLRLEIPNKYLYKHLPMVVDALKNKPCQIVQLVDTHYVLLNIAEKTRRKHRYFEWLDVDNILLETFLFVGVRRYHALNNIRHFSSVMRPPKCVPISVFGLYHIRSPKIFTFQATLPEPKSEINIISSHPSPATIHEDLNTTDDSVTYDYPESDSDEDGIFRVTCSSGNNIFASPQNKISSKRNHLVTISPEEKTECAKKRQKQDQCDISLFKFNDHINSTIHAVTPDKAQVDTLNIVKKIDY